MGNELICPECGKSLVRATAKIEGKWFLVWLCDCGLTPGEVQELERQRESHIRKYGTNAIRA